MLAPLRAPGALKPAVLAPLRAPGEGHARIGRRGSVFSDRYHSRALRTPLEVRRALLYVLQNHRHHAHGVLGLDPLSSAAYFDGFSDGKRASPGGGIPVVEPSTSQRTTGSTP